MKRKRFTAEQIIQILKEADAGARLADLGRRYGVSENSIYRWRQKYAGMTTADVRRLRDLEQENARLKKLLANRDLEIDAMREVLRKNS